MEAPAMKAASTTSLRISVAPKIGEIDISYGSLSPSSSLPVAPEVVGFPEDLDRRRATGAKIFSSRRHHDSCDASIEHHLQGLVDGDDKGAIEREYRDDDICTYLAYHQTWNNQEGMGMRY